MPDEPHALFMAVLLDFAQVPLDGALSLLAMYPFLLGDRSFAMLDELIGVNAQAGNDQVIARLRSRRTLLSRAREVGVEAAGAEAREAVLPPELLEAHAVHEKFLATGMPEDADRAVTAWQAVLAHPTVVDSPALFRLVLRDVAGALINRYQVLGDHADLDRAVESATAALDDEIAEVAPRSPHPVEQGFDEHVAGRMEASIVEIHRYRTGMSSRQPRGSPGSPPLFNKLRVSSSAERR